MEIKVGDRFRPLENSRPYGPKKWEKDSEGVWVEQEMTEEEKNFSRLESTLAWASPGLPWERSTPITEADAEAEPRHTGYVDGFAVFPKVENINTSTEEGRARAAKQEREWEARAQAMHENQKPIKVEPKPEINELEARKNREMLRGD